MPLLTVNNMTIPCKIDGVSLTYEEIGAAIEGLQGGILKDNRGTLRVVDIETTSLSYAQADALRRVIEGQGHAWNFEDTGAGSAWQYSSKGLGYTSASGATQNSGAVRFGTYGLQLAATTGNVIWPITLGSAWTAMVWRDTGGGHEHYIETSAGDYYLDGLATTQEGWFNIGAATVQLRNTTGGIVGFDDFVVLPFVLPADLCTQVGAATAAWGQTPELAVTGQLFNGDSLTMLSTDLGASIVAQRGTTSWESNKHKLSVTLREQVPGTIAAPYSDTYSIIYDGTTSYLESVSGNYTQLDGQTNFSLSLWYYVTSASTNDYVLSRHGTAPNIQFSIFSRGTNWRFHMYNAGLVYVETNDAPLSTSTWHHLMVVKSGSTVTLYTDNTVNSLTASGTMPTTINTPATTPLRFGVSSAASPSGFFPGTIGDTAIWVGTAFNSTQRGEVYNSGAGADFDNLATTPRPTNWWWMGDRDIYNRIADHGSSSTLTPLSMNGMTSGSITANAP